MVRSGFYRHYKGHAYYVHGVACDVHKGNRRIVIYTSVKTENGDGGFKYLARDEDEFEQWVSRDGKKAYPAPLSRQDLSNAKVMKLVPRFERIADPMRSILP